MAKQVFKDRPNDGGSYRKTKAGYERIDTPQKPNPGKAARRKADKKAQQSAGNTTAPAKPGASKE